MTIKEALKKYHKIEIELLLANILGKPKEFLYLESAHQLSANQLISLQKLIKRRENGEPVAYILGYKDFCGLRFKVNKNVLIPRPESEWLVERLVQYLLLLKEEYPALAGGGGWSKYQQNSNPSVSLRLPPSLKKGRMLRESTIKILDVGTGSGCIVTSLGKGLRVKGIGCSLYGSDISSAAIKIAKENAKKHKVKVKFIQSDLFSNIKPKFDVIIANLPYVPKKVYNLLIENLKYEPITALTDGTKSFQIYRRFFEQVGGHINRESIILLEIDPSSRKYLEEYKKKYLPSGRMKFYKDFNGFWRYAEIKFT